MLGVQKRTLVFTGVAVGTVVAAVMYLRRRRAANACSYELLMQEDSQVGVGVWWVWVGLCVRARARGRACVRACDRASVRGRAWLPACVRVFE